jgi:hypothetical protein
MSLRSTMASVVTLAEKSPVAWCMLRGVGRVTGLATAREQTPRNRMKEAMLGSIFLQLCTPVNVYCRNYLGERSKVVYCGKRFKFQRVCLGGGGTCGLSLGQKQPGG